MNCGVPLSVWKNPHRHNGNNAVTTLVPSFLIESSSFLQGTRKCIKAWMSSNFGKIPAPKAHKVSLLNGTRAGICAFVRLCVHSTISIMNIPETGRPIIFYMKHHWSRGKDALGFGANKIRTQHPGDSKTYLTPLPMTFFYAKLIIGTT